MERRDQLVRIFPKEIRMILQGLSVDFGKVQEIRMRIQAPLLIIVNGREYVVTAGGQLVCGADRIDRNVFVVSREMLQETMEYVSSHSRYAFEEEIRQGFLTIQGGHRIGLAGRVVMDEYGIRTIKHIAFLNIRLAHQVRGCADRIMPYLYLSQGRCGETGNSCPGHTLIISPPRCGKTTLLRDIIRQLSDGGNGREGVTVGVVDERSEIAACYQGIPQNDLGIRTDVLDCCPKARGMMMLIRSMSPQVVAVDEIGGKDDLEALQYVMNCGCKVVATVHGQSFEDVKKKPGLGEMVEEKLFERYLVLDAQNGPGHVAMLCDGYGKILFRENGRN